MPDYGFPAARGGFRMNETPHVSGKCLQSVIPKGAGIGVALLLALLSLLLVPRAYAEEIAVTTMVDSIDAHPGGCAALTPGALPGGGDGAISLREALCAANNNLGADTISLPSGVYTLTLYGAGEDDNVSGDLDITDDVIIVGEGPLETIIDGDDADRVFHIDPTGARSVDAQIRQVMIRNGDAGTLVGGGIYNRGELTIKDSDVSGNTAAVFGFGLGAFGGAGIFNDGRLTVTDSDIYSNTLTGGASDGGGIYNFGALKVTGGSISLNVSTEGGGGGLTNDGTASLTGVAIADNQAQDRGLDGAARGGGILNRGIITVTACTIAGNEADTVGGGICNSRDLAGGAAVITGTTLYSNTTGGDGGGIDSDGTLTVSHSSVLSNTANANGGGIRSAGALHLARTAVRGNTAGGTGGGIQVVSSKGVTISTIITGSTVTRNAALSEGGGIHFETVAASGVEVSLTGTTVSENDAGTKGGGLGFWLTNQSSCQASLTNSSIVSNTAHGGDGGGVQLSVVRGSKADLELQAVTVSTNEAASDGGAVDISTGANSTATVTLSNSTLSGNRAGTDGGGISAPGGGDQRIHLIHCTVTENTADANGGGLLLSNTPGTSMKHTIVAGNWAEGHGPEIHGTVGSEDYNLIQDTEYVTITGLTEHNILGTEPGLGPLTGTGRPRTHALFAGSPAVDAIPAAACALPVDQRGEPRPWDGNQDGVAACDMGAYELHPIILYLPSVMREPLVPVRLPR